MRQREIIFTKLLFPLRQKFDFSHKGNLTLTTYIKKVVNEIFVVVPYILIILKFFHQQMHALLNIYNFKIYNQNIIAFAATCFGPSGPSSGSPCWSLLKLHFCRIICKMHRYKFYCCTVHFDNIKILFTNKCTLYDTYRMLKLDIKTSKLSRMLRCFICKL
jgi:hypothetical protein